MCRINRVRLWVHDALIVPCGLRRWPRWMRLVYWTYFLAWNDWEGPIAFRTAVDVARIIA